jgi:hypothetical protein
VTKLENLSERVEELERILVLRGFRRAATRQGAAISFVVENIDVLKKDGG